jgi:hypothetical protein
MCYPLFVEQVAHLQLNATFYGWKGKCCPMQMQAFQNENNSAISSYIGTVGPNVKY